MRIVWNRCNGLGKVALKVDNVGLARLRGLTLQVDLHPLFLGLTVLGGVLLDSVDEVLAGSGVGDVFDADVDALLDVAVADDLVEDDSQGGFGYVVYHSGFAVVPFVRHTIQFNQQSAGCPQGIRRWIRE